MQVCLDVFKQKPTVMPEKEKEKERKPHAYAWGF